MRVLYREFLWRVVGRAMDPYHALGVRRSCTREEVKEAFRARAWHAHPDRGGAEPDFIRLCTAYNQIIEELAQNPSLRSREPEQAPRSGRPPTPPGASGQGGGRRSRRPARRDRSRKPPDPSWEPDLVILDEDPRNARRSKPFDPDWSPDLVLLDEAARGVRAGVPPDPRADTTTYDPWLRRVSPSAAHGDSFWRSGPARFLGVMLLLGLIAANLWLCWVVWNQDP